MCSGLYGNHIFEEVTEMAELTLKETEIVQRAIGIVEGVSFGVSGEVASALVVAVEMLDSVFGGDGNDA